MGGTAEHPDPSYRGGHGTPLVLLDRLARDESLTPGAKFEAFASLEGTGARTFVMLEDWANDGPPVSEAAAREMFEGLFRDDLTGTGRWQVAGTAIDPESLAMPMLNIVSTTDRIVPAASAVRAGERIDLALGHVGMVVGSRAPHMLWEPLAGWLSRTAAE